jgi:Phage capsid family.
MAKTLFEMKQNLQMLGENAKKRAEEYEEVLTDVKASSETIKAAQSAMEDAKQRFDGMKERVETREIAEQVTLESSNKGGVETPEQKQVKEYAQTLRDVIKNGASVDDARISQLTGAKVNGGNDDAAGGDNFLPVTLSNEIISEPDIPNPLRGNVATSALVNLQIPTMEVDFGDAWDIIGEGQEANEATLKGGKITFGRFESRVRIGLTDTLLAGTSLALMQYAQSKLTNAASSLELARAFADKSKTGEEHMSFYNAKDAIKSVEGEDLYDAISNALADLSDADRGVAKIFMTRADYNKIIKTLANGSATLFGAQPETVLGAPVEFTSYAKKPVVGNFAMYHQNYDPQGSMIEQYRKPETGVNYAQYTLWYDAAIKRASAFRIVEVKVSESTPTA